MDPLKLTRSQPRRIEKLAALAGRTPQAMLRFVLRDGVEASDRDVRETLQADDDIDRYGAMPHEQVIERAYAAIERHAAKRRRKAA
jgi:hypothetical protein